MISPVHFGNIYSSNRYNAVSFQKAKNPAEKNPYKETVKAAIENEKKYGDMYRRIHAYEIAAAAVTHSLFCENKSIDKNNSKNPANCGEIENVNNTPQEEDTHYLILKYRVQLAQKKYERIVGEYKAGSRSKEDCEYCKIKLDEAICDLYDYKSANGLN